MRSKLLLENKFLLKQNKHLLKEKLITYEQTKIEDHPLLPNQSGGEKSQEISGSTANNTKIKQITNSI